MSAVAAIPPPELVRAASALDPDRLDALIGELLRVRADRLAPRIGADETALLARVNAGPPADVWPRYRELTAARRAETLSAADHAELMRLTDAVELYQADRVAALAELAAVRRVSLPELAATLGLTPAE